MLWIEAQVTFNLFHRLPGHSLHCRPHVSQHHWTASVQVFARFAAGAQDWSWTSIPASPEWRQQIGTQDKNCVFLHIQANWAAGTGPTPCQAAHACRPCVDCLAGGTAWAGQRDQLVAGVRTCCGIKSLVVCPAEPTVPVRISCKLVVAHRELSLGPVHLYGQNPSLPLPTNCFPRAGITQVLPWRMRACFQICAMLLWSLCAAGFQSSNFTLQHLLLCSTLPSLEGCLGWGNN